MPIGSPVKQLSIVECFKKQHLNKLTNIPKAKVVIDLTSDEPDEALDSENNNGQAEPISVQRSISLGSTNTNISFNSYSFFEHKSEIKRPLLSPSSSTLAVPLPEQEVGSQTSEENEQIIEVKGLKRARPNTIVFSQNENGNIDSVAESEHRQISNSISSPEVANAGFLPSSTFTLSLAEEVTDSQTVEEDDHIIEASGLKRSKPNIIVSSQDENNNNDSFAETENSQISLSISSQEEDDDVDFLPSSAFTLSPAEQESGSQITKEGEDSQIGDSMSSQEEDADFPPSSNEEFEEAESEIDEDQPGLLSDENWLKKVTDTLRPLSFPVDQQLGIGQEFMAYKEQWGYANKYKIVNPTESDCLLCEHKDISVFFKIKNIQTAEKLYTGSKCIKQFRVIGEDNILLDDADSKTIIAIAIDDAYAELSEPRRAVEWFFYR